MASHKALVQRVRNLTRTNSRANYKKGTQAGNANRRIAAHSMKSLRKTVGSGSKGLNLYGHGKILLDRHQMHRN